MTSDDQLSRRERQIMQIIFARGEASATEVLASMADPPTRTSVRTFLRILETKGYLKHRKRSREFIFRPTHERRQEGRSAFRRMLDTFFQGSLEKAVATHLSDPRAEVSSEELLRLWRLIKEAKNKEK